MVYNIYNTYYMYSGRLSDILGRKGAMLLGLTLFSSVVLTLCCCPPLMCGIGGGTLLCGLAPSMDMLILARAIAGMVSTVVYGSLLIK